MKKILLLTDSLALPRDKPEACRYEDTWPQLLKQSNYIIHQASVGGATSGDLLTQVTYHKMFEPDYVIVQSGIVDCAPRFMTRLELTLCRKYGYVGKAIIKLMSNNMIRRLRRITYTSKKSFSKNIDSIRQRFNTTPVFFIGIIPPHPLYEKVLPGVTKKIREYNSILKTKENYISVDDFDLSGTMSDHHHLNSYGHKQIYQRIINRLDA
ncbi:MAG: SGNH/GDSL hydrolase family protein [Taibaiella sp.]|jgi:lysophospholipase L1-like esterase